MQKQPLSPVEWQQLRDIAEATLSQNPSPQARSDRSEPAVWPERLNPLQPVAQALRQELERRHSERGAVACGTH